LARKSTRNTSFQAMEPAIGETGWEAAPRAAVITVISVVMSSVPMTTVIARLGSAPLGSINRETINDAAIIPRISSALFIPEATPSCPSGTSSGINPCWEPWEILEVNCKPTYPIASTQREFPQPRSTRKNRSRKVPSRMSGTRRPQRETTRSLIAPATGCTTIATIKPTKVSKPR